MSISPTRCANFYESSPLRNSSHEKCIWDTTTAPKKKLPHISVTQHRRSKAFPFIFVLLALFVALGSAAALWSLFGNHKGVLSVTPALHPQYTVNVVVSPSPDPTIISKSTGGSGKVVPSLSPTAPSSVSSTPVPIAASIRMDIVAQTLALAATGMLLLVRLAQVRLPSMKLCRDNHRTRVFIPGSCLLVTVPQPTPSY